MHPSLKYYSTYGPSGKIYVSCKGHLHHSKIHYHLHDATGKVASKTAYGNELIFFHYSYPSVYTIHAEILREHEPPLELCSEEIKPVPYDKFPPHIVEVKPLKTPLKLVPDQINNLVVQFTKDGLERLNNESSQEVPIYCQVRHAIQFKPNLAPSTIDKIVTYSPELENLRYLYSINLKMHFSAPGSYR